MLSRKAGQTPEVDDDDGQAPDRQRHGDRPDAGHRPDRRPAPRLLGEKREIQRGRTTSDIRKFMDDDHGERQDGDSE